jgi:Tfp pilus assembly protein PilN
VTDDKYKDIVEEVFSKSKNADDRVSALFTRLKHPPQVSLEQGEKNLCDLKDSPSAKDIGSSGNKLFQSAKNVKYEFGPKRIIKNKKSIHPVRIVAVAVIFVLAFLVGSYLRQYGNGSAKMLQEQQSVNRSEIVSPLEKQPLFNVQPESVSTKIVKNSMPLDWQRVINWGRLLDEISAIIPKAVQLSVLESGDSSQLFLEGRALSADAIYDFVDALSTNSQVKSAELTQARPGKWNSQNLLKFSICCCLVSDTKTPGSVDGDSSNSGFDRGRLFTPKEAEKFFGSTQPVSEQAGCKVKSLLLSPKDAVFEDKKTNGHITKKHAALTLLGDYQNILKAVEKLQNRSQGVWFDSVSIQEDSGTGRLECSIDISVYVAESAG